MSDFEIERLFLRTKKEMPDNFEPDSYKSEKSKITRNEAQKLIKDISADESKPIILSREYWANVGKKSQNTKDEAQVVKALKHGGETGLEKELNRLWKARCKANDEFLEFSAELNNLGYLFSFSEKIEKQFEIF